MTSPAAAGPLLGRTAWARSVQTPLRAFLATETGSAMVLFAATVAALAWANVGPDSYRRVWATELAVRLGDMSLAMDLQRWVNSGLMTFFFLVVGLEARREFDMGELRDRRRLTLPLVACLSGMLVPILVFLAFTAGHPSAHGWGTAMSTDTAFALGMLALLGRRLPDRVRGFMLTVTVVDDLVALTVIAVAYSDHVNWRPLALVIGLFAIVLGLRAAGNRTGLLYFALGAAAWVALFESGVDPVVIGLAMGLITFAYPAARDDLERASDLFRSFREQPTAELARSARLGLQTAISPNDRLQQAYHPWTSYLIVPLFAVANAGVPVSGSALASAFSSPITLGIVAGYVVGKPLGILGGAWLVRLLTGGRLRPPVGWAAVGGVGTVAGIGFTVSLLIAALAFSGEQLEQAKIGILAAAGGSFLVTWLIFRATQLLPGRLRVRALIGTTEQLVDLAAPVDPDRDHIRGPAGAPITIVEYGDFECPFCGRAEPPVRELLAGAGDVRYVWRHLPLNDVHPRAQVAAEASESAAAQGRFWEFHDLLLHHQDNLGPMDLLGYAQQLGLDTDRFKDAVHRAEFAGRVAEDVDSADLSGVSGTPSFFINGRRHHGAYDLEALTAAVKQARTRIAIRERGGRNKTVGAGG